MTYLNRMLGIPLFYIFYQMKENLWIIIYSQSSATFPWMKHLYQTKMTNVCWNFQMWKSFWKFSKKTKTEFHLLIHQNNILYVPIDAGLFDQRIKMYTVDMTLSNEYVFKELLYFRFYFFCLPNLELTIF